MPANEESHRSGEPCEKRLSKDLAISFCNAMLRRCWSWSPHKFSLKSSPDAKAVALASSDQTLRACGPHLPPVASTMSGVNEKPWSLHCRFVSRWLHLKSSYRTSGASGSRAEVARSSSRNPLVTAKSQAAAGPPAIWGCTRRRGDASCARSGRRGRSRFHRRVG